jgi:hypothetical protein
MPSIENREVLVQDRNEMARLKADWKSEDFRKEYFAMLDFLHAGDRVGPLPGHFLDQLAFKYRLKQEPAKTAPKSPALIK